MNTQFLNHTFVSGDYSDFSDRTNESNIVEMPVKPATDAGHQLNHKHVIVTAFLKNPPRTAELVETWLTKLVDLVDMKILFGPHVTRCDTEGNEGVTGIVCIETSHASAHIWDTLDEPFMKFDLYSCKDFSIPVILNHIQQFQPTSLSYMLIDRNSDIKVLEQKTETYNIKYD